jgi:hypothetical protein
MHTHQLLRHAASGAAIAALLMVGACNLDEVVTVEDIDVATPGSLRSADALPVLLAAAIGDFQVAYSGNTGTEGQIQYSGMMADEFLNSESFPTRIEVDMRDVNRDNASTEGVFRTIQRARAMAELAARRFEEFAPTQRGRAEALALAGFSYILVAENYCSGVAFSRINDQDQEEYGEPLTTEEMLTEAVASFDAALGVAPATSDIAHLARVGKGRALVNLGRFADAVTAVQAVPDTFRYSIFHTENSGRQQNGIFNFATLGRRWTVANREGVNGLPFVTEGDTANAARDPRIPLRRNPASAGVGFDATTPLFIQLKYPNRSADVVLASGVEARLIEAEAALKAGNNTEWLAKLNAVRTPRHVRLVLHDIVNPAPAAPLAPLTDPGTPDARIDLHFKERAYWLFLTSHRLGDLRRLVRPATRGGYGRAEDAVFPSGGYFKGGLYGDDMNFPIPIVEENNPNVEGCLNRDP